MPFDQCTRMIAIAALAEEKDDLLRPAWRKFDDHLHHGAGIESGAELTVEHLAADGGRGRKRTVATDERLAIAGCGCGRLARMGEGDASRELAVVAVPREDRAGLPLALRHDMAALAVTRRAEHPFGIREDAQAADDVAAIR